MASLHISHKGKVVKGVKFSATLGVPLCPVSPLGCKSAVSKPLPHFPPCSLALIHTDKRISSTHFIWPGGAVQKKNINDLFRTEEP